MICPRHAWGDESIRSHGLDAPADLLGASVVDSDDVEATREVLESLRPTNGKLHWHDLRRRERRRVGEAVEAMTTGKPLSDSIADGLETFEIRP